MKIRYLFCFLALLLLAAWVILFILTLRGRGWLFYAGEGIITFSLFFLAYFHHKVVKPLNTIGNGMDLLREQDFSSRLAKVGQPEADRVVLVFNRMMNQLKDERLRLREQNHFLDLLIGASPMGVIILTLDGRISMANTAALRFLNCQALEDVDGHLLCELPSPLADRLEHLPMDNTETVRLDDANIYRCSRLSFADRGFMHPFLLIESLTAEVMKAEKKAYETVIRMTAHEVNNTVAGITSTIDSVTDALEEMKEDTEELRAVMCVAMERCYSMNRFITRLADVVKIPDPQMELVCLNDLVEDCKMFMENACRGRRITLHLGLCEASPMVKADRTLFEQVLVNIIKNAAESIGDKGDIFIRTAISPVMLELADTGHGISPEAETKLFSPFFSTKPDGEGIGLMFVREVLQKHACTFSLRTYPDGLTRFCILFPAVASNRLMA